MSADERPGGWVDGIGWVARLRDLDPYDIAANPDGRTAQARIHRSAGVTPEWGYVTVVGWANGTEPEPPVLATYDATAGETDRASNLRRWLLNGPADVDQAVADLMDWWATGVIPFDARPPATDEQIAEARRQADAFLALIDHDPPAAGGATPDPAERHERISGASVYCSCGNGWPCLEGTTPR